MLYFIHGYQSSPTGEKAVLFQQTLQAVPLTYRECAPEDLVVADCLSRISHALEGDTDIKLIGSSLGGFLAAQTALTHPSVNTLLLLNPAILPPGIDVHTIHGMPTRILADMQNPALFATKIPADIVILRGTHDTVVPDPWVYQFAAAQEATMRFLHDDHRFSQNLSRLPHILTSYLKK